MKKAIQAQVFREKLGTNELEVESTNICIYGLSMTVGIFHEVKCMITDCLVRRPHIWDLHIHTPLGTPTKKNYGGVSAEQFVDELLKVYADANYPIDMISFTDHNQINVDAYNVFRAKAPNIAVIPGIEVDVYLTSGAPNSKHIIFQRMNLITLPILMH